MKMKELLKDSIRWVERDGKLVLQTKRYVFHYEKKDTLFKDRQGYYETIWDDVLVVKDEHANA
jgi:hypothetical protein